MATHTPSVRSDVLEAFRQQIDSCRTGGSDFTARLLEHALADLEAGGPLAALLEDWEGRPLLDALCMRVLGAVQGVALEGRAPELAAFYPCLGGTPRWPETGRAFLDVIAREGEALRPRLEAQVQTNEVRRCAGLLGGFLRAAGGGLPLRLLEIGSSAGLLLFFDRYRYELGPHRYGPSDAEVVIEAEWRGTAPDLSPKLEVASRRGCDLFPLDLRDPEAYRRMQSFLWADQVDRHALLRGAVAALPSEGAPLERIAARDFAARELATPQAGVATVFYHASMWWYLAPEEREDVTASLEAAGARATAEAPLHWLRSEPPNLEFGEIRMRSWPGGSDVLLARVHHHGRWVEWLDAP